MPPSERREWPQLLLLLALPLPILLSGNAGIFSQAGFLDPWYYYGFFRNFHAFKSYLFQPTYFGSRLSWLLPGFLVHRFLSPVKASYVLHLGVLYVCIFSTYYVVRQLADRRAALLTALCLGSYAYTWSAIGWDYPDGAGLAYYLLTTALLVAAIGRPENRLWLVLAGSAWAGMEYTNIAWAFYSPVFAITYVGLRESKQPKWREALHAVLWGGAGFIAATVLLGAINLAVEGTFWFYVPSIFFAMAGKPTQWKIAGFQYGSANWLFAPAICSLGALALCGWKALAKRVGPNRTIVVLACNMIVSSAVAIWLNEKSQPVLQYSFYASYLIPPALLLLGVTVFAQAHRLRTIRFSLVAALAFALAVIPWWLSPNGGARQLFPAAAALLFGAILLRRSSAVCLGLVAWCALSSAIALNFPNVAAVRTNEQAFRRITTAAETVERVRGDRPVRFWFSSRDPRAADFESISACYLWTISLFGTEFPALPEGPKTVDGTLVVLLSSEPDAPAQAATSLAARGILAHTLTSETIADGMYRIYFLDLAIDPSTIEPLMTASADPLPLPGGSVRRTAGGLLIDTGSTLRGWSAAYPEMIAPRNGRYRFVLRYRLLSGAAAFGLANSAMSDFETQAEGFTRAGAEWQQEFSVDAKAGQAMRLVLANGRNMHGRSRYIVDSVTAYRYKDAAPVTATAKE
jgi:hypothetical protein